MSSSATNGLSANPFSQWTINGNPNHTIESGVPNSIATLILSYLRIRQVKTVMESLPSAMNRYHVYRGIMGDANCLNHNERAKSSYTGEELGEFQRLLSLEGQALINGQPQVIKSWAELLAGSEMSLTRLKSLDLSDSPDMTDQDVIALTKSSPNLTKLVLPGAFPTDVLMAVLRTNCPQAAIYPTAMTEHEWAHPAEFMAKLPPPPQEIADFINSPGPVWNPRPIWEGKTAVETHMVMPKVNKIVRNIDGHAEIVPWTLDNVDKLDKATDGVGCSYIMDGNLNHANDKPSEVGFEWIVFTKDIFPQSRNLTYADQKQLAENWGYEMPDAVDATTCMLWENRFSGNRIYNVNPWTYTRCSEMNGDWGFVAGAFAQNGVAVRETNGHGDHIGVGGLKKFSIKKSELF